MISFFLIFFKHCILYYLFLFLRWKFYIISTHFVVEKEFSLRLLILSCVILIRVCCNIIYDVRKHRNLWNFRKVYERAEVFHLELWRSTNGRLHVNFCKSIGRQRQVHPSRLRKFIEVNPCTFRTRARRQDSNIRNFLNRLRALPAYARTFSIRDNIISMGIYSYRPTV